MSLRQALEDHAAKMAEEVLVEPKLVQQGHKWVTAVIAVHEQQGRQMTGAWTAGFAAAWREWARQRRAVTGATPPYSWHIRAPGEGGPKGQKLPEGRQSRIRQQPGGGWQGGEAWAHVSLGDTLWSHFLRQPTGRHAAYVGYAVGPFVSLCFLKLGPGGLRVNLNSTPCQPKTYFMSGKGRKTTGQGLMTEGEGFGCAVLQARWACEVLSGCVHLQNELL